MTAFDWRWSFDPFIIALIALCAAPFSALPAIKVEIF